MIQEIVDGVDAHRATAIEMYGEGIVDHPDYDWKYRQSAKMNNFGTLFGAQAFTLQMQLRRQFGIEVDISTCQGFIDAVYERYQSLARWQRTELIEEVVDLKYLEVPYIGYSRRFKGSKGTILASYANEILNLRVQACAACVNMSARFEIQKYFRRKPVEVVLDVYDAIDLEGDLAYLDEVKQVVPQIMESSPYLQKLYEFTGAHVPMKVDFKVSALRLPTREGLELMLDRTKNKLYTVHDGSGIFSQQGELV